MESKCVFATEGDPQSPLIRLRCGVCATMKDMAQFPPSALTWRRGRCKPCAKLARANQSVASRKLASARTRFKGQCDVRIADVERLLEAEGVDEGDEKVVWLAKIDPTKAFRCDNMRLARVDSV